MGHAEKLKNIDEIIKNINNIRYTDMEKLIELSEKALLLSDDIGYELGSAISKLMLAEAYHNMGNFDKALIFVIDALSVFIKEDLYDLQCNSYNLLGIIFFELGDYEKSMDFYITCEGLTENIDSIKKYEKDASSKKVFVKTYNNIAEIYKVLNDYKKAICYCQNAYDIDKELDFNASKGVTILSLGELHYLLGDYEKAEELSYKALRYLKHYNCTLVITDVYNLLALIYWKKRAYEKAEEYFSIALNIDENTATVYYHIEVLINYYEYLVERDNLDNGLQYLKKAFDLAYKNNMLERITSISELIAEFYESVGDYKEAYKYSKLHFENEKKYIDSLHQRKINNINIKKKFQEIENEKKDMLQKNESLKRKSDDLQGIIEKISIISELGQKITSTLNLNSIITILYSSIKNIIDFTYFAVGLFDEETSVVKYLDAIKDNKKTNANSISINSKQSLAAICIKTSQTIIINDMSTEYIKYLDEDTYKSLATPENITIHSLIFSPLIINNKAIGLVTIQSKEKNAFTAYPVEVLKSLSSYAAIAINNAIKSMQLEEEIEKTRKVQTELETLNEKLLSLSEKDSMTDIPNRRKFDAYLNCIWDESIIKKKNISLILIDIDYFKEYNDNYGHIEGDKCIIKVAKALQDISNQKYFAARYGGDEFIIVLPHSSLENAMKFAEILKDKVAELNISHEYSKIADKVTLSIGVTSMVPEKSIAINEFIRQADNALYIAKKRGRNQIASF